MWKKVIIAVVAALFVLFALGETTAEAKRGRGRGGYNAGRGGVSVSTSTGGFGGAAWTGHSTGVAISVGGGRHGGGRGYGRHNRHRTYRAWPGRYSRGYGRYGHSGAAVSLSFGGPRGHVTINSGPGRVGYAPGFGYGRGYGRRPVYGRYGYGYGFSGPIVTPSVIVTVPAGAPVPYMSRVWVPGRLTDWGYSAGYWDMRPLRRGHR